MVAIITQAIVHGLMWTTIIWVTYEHITLAIGEILWINYLMSLLYY